MTPSALVPAPRRQSTLPRAAVALALVAAMKAGKPAAAGMGG